MGLRRDFSFSSSAANSEMWREKFFYGISLSDHTGILAEMLSSFAR
jgi:hypothetical protein